MDSGGNYNVSIEADIDVLAKLGEDGSEEIDATVSATLLDAGEGRF